MKYTDACDFLQVPKTATKEEARDSYRRLAQIHHPDKGGDTDKFKELTLAYKTFTKNRPFFHSGAQNSTKQTQSTPEATPESTRYWENNISPQFQDAMYSYVKKNQAKEMHSKEETRQGAWGLFFITIIIFLTSIGTIPILWAKILLGVLLLLAVVHSRVRRWIGMSIRLLIKTSEVLLSPALGILMLAIVAYLLLWYFKF